MSTIARPFADGAQEDSVVPKLAALREALASLGGAVVCFSGGVDSGLVLAVAHDVLGDRAVALTGTSASLPAEESEVAARFAAEIGSRHLLRDTTELRDPRYAANPDDRCYHCKSALFRLAGEVARELRLPEILEGTNVSDLSGHRPGRRAAQCAGVRSPLVDAGFTKEEVREAARRLGLRIWDKPAFACLASRIPTGTKITAGRLAQVAACESVLRELGFLVFRARYRGNAVRIEVGRDEVPRLAEEAVRGRLLSACLAAGFAEMEIEPNGYVPERERSQSGSRATDSGEIVTCRIA